jgi:hypothetical protein
MRPDRFKSGLIRSTRAPRSECRRTSAPENLSSSDAIAQADQRNVLRVPQRILQPGFDLLYQEAPDSSAHSHQRSLDSLWLLFPHLGNELHQLPNAYFSFLTWWKHNW